MNKKGFTMVELMVSIAMISIVMVFLVRLLVDVRYDVTNEQYDTKDQINRAEIIKTIENDLKDEIIKDVTDDGSNQNSLKITLTTLDNKSAAIEIDSNDNFKYTTISGSTKKWPLKAKDSNSETHYQKTNIELNVIRGSNTTAQDVDPNDYLIIINIPVLVDNFEKRKDSQMDNIILTFYGYSNTLIGGKSCLNENGDCD